ncbi:MAG: FecCD family ABC transporter permease [Longimicrobiales bacterium]
MLRRLSNAQIYLLLGFLLAAVLFASAGIGAFSFTPNAMVRYIGQYFGWIRETATDQLGRNVFLKLRLPRVLLAGLTGAVLSVSGTLMQGLFRNPIVEPGLVGTSAGAALGAAAVFVFGETAAVSFTAPLGSFGVPVFAFLGAFGATVLVYRLSTSFGKVNVFTLLLAGIAVNAVCAAGTGFLSYIARDPQARNITFWNLGTFTTATWKGVALVAFFFAGCFLWSMRYGKALNALMLGEDEAASMGVNPQRLIWQLLVVNTVMVAVATAMVGVIAFIGLVVPHLLRLMKSADYTFLLPASALLGALLMEAIDITARLIIPPAELPIGIITAVVGAPVFLGILLRQQRAGAMGFYG